MSYTSPKQTYSHKYAKIQRFNRRIRILSKTSKERKESIQQMRHLDDERESLNKHLLLSVESLQQLGATSEIKSAMVNAEASLQKLNEQLLSLGGLEDVPEPLTLSAFNTGYVSVCMYVCIVSANVSVCWCSK